MARPTDYIYSTISLLQTIWLNCPDQRFTQLICNFIGDVDALYHQEFNETIHGMCEAALSMGIDVNENDYLMWGTYGKAGDQPLKYITITQMDTGHIKNVLKTQKLGDIMHNAMKNELDKRGVDLEEDTTEIVSGMDSESVEELLECKKKKCATSCCKMGAPIEEDELEEDSYKELLEALKAIIEPNIELFNCCEYCKCEEDCNHECECGKIYGDERFDEEYSEYDDEIDDEEFEQSSQSEEEDYEGSYNVLMQMYEVKDIQNQYLYNVLDEIETLDDANIIKAVIRNAKERHHLDTIIGNRKIGS